MSEPIENYALIGNCQTAALVSNQGSIDWLCLPHFDSPACFAKLLADEDAGFWRIAPTAEFRAHRRYREDTMILETTFETDTGSARLTDAMIVGADRPTLVRSIEGLAGEIELDCEFVVRFDYGSIVPWVERTPERFKRAVGGPDSVILQTSFRTEGKDLRTIGRFTVREGDRETAALIWQPSHEIEVKEAVEVRRAIEDTADWWRKWIAQCTYRGKDREAVERSLLLLKSLTFAPTGGIVAAPTTSLPEDLGGERNWDYRFSWVRDSTFTLYSLITTGFIHEAEEWRRWLVRAVAGTPSQVNIMYGIRGERRLDEVELSWLDGYEKSKPVRVGNDAYTQRQLDIFGELMDTLQLARRSGLSGLTAAWNLQKEIVEFVLRNWSEPDEGIWETRGPRRHFVHSKVMAWVAIDRAVQAVENFGLDGDVKRWRKTRAEIRDEIMNKGVSPKSGSFTQSYGAENVDASLLLLPLVGFIPATDPVMRKTAQRIEEELVQDGFVRRYDTRETADGLAGDEGKFLACTFWLADYHVLAGEAAAARAIFDRLLGLRNDVGLLAEEYDTSRNRMVGNFPQALSHIALVNTAVNLWKSRGSARDRSQQNNARTDVSEGTQKDGRSP